MPKAGNWQDLKLPGEGEGKRTLVNGAGEGRARSKLMSACGVKLCVSSVRVKQARAQLLKGLFLV